MGTGDHHCGEGPDCSVEEGPEDVHLDSGTPELKTKIHTDSDPSQHPYRSSIALQFDSVK